MGNLDQEQYTQQYTSDDTQNPPVKPWVLPEVKRWQDTDTPVHHNRDVGDETREEPPKHEHCHGFSLGQMCCGCLAYPEGDD